MKNILQLLFFSILLIAIGCNTVGPSEKINTTTSQTSDIGLNQNKYEPRIRYVTYGSFCGECGNDCTKMYKNYLIGNATTFWTDKTDSYFSKNKWKFETELSSEAQNIGFNLVENIPPSILKTDSTRNVFGCPDCTDGCGLYFEFQLDEEDSKPIVFVMEYNLDNTAGEIKELGVLIKKTIEELEKYR